MPPPEAQPPAPEPVATTAPLDVKPEDTAAVPPAVGSLAAEEAPVSELPPVTHNEPILTGGASGPAVERLVRLLAAAGFASNSIVKGENPHAILDNTVMADVQRFWAAHDVAEPPELFEGRDVAAALETGKWVGPHTWQALIDYAKGLVGE
jgi:hypothetical protein